MKLKSTNTGGRILLAVLAVLLLTICNTGQGRAQETPASISPTESTGRSGALPQREAHAPRVDPVPPPISSKAKLKYGLRQAFYSPGAFIGPAIGAGIRQAEDSAPPAKTDKDKFADYLSNYARNFGTRSTTELFGAGIYPVIFRQNPIYTPLRNSSRGQASRRERLLYAIGRAVIAPGDNGKMRPNYSRLAGNFTGAALTNIWERDTPSKRNALSIPTEINHERGVGPTFKRFGLSVGFDAVSNVFEEFFKFGR